MKIAYLIFAYKNPQLIRKEIQVLSSESSVFLIHIDQKADIREFAEIRGHNVFFTEHRVRVHWAEFSGVRAILCLMREALESAEKPDYLVLLSGSEYPIRSRKYIEAYFARNIGSEFIQLIKVPGPGKPLSRITTLRYESDKPIRRLAYGVLAKVGFAQRDYRRYLGDMEPFCGRTWWALSRAACEYVLRTTQERPKLAEFFANTFAPEEAYFHTILGNSPFAARARGALVYEDWRGMGSHPEMIGERKMAFFESQESVFDLAEASTELLFARKFSDADLWILDRIERMAARKGDYARS